MSDPLSLIFAALADPTRREILRMLTEDDMAVTDLAAPFEMSLAAVSKHIGILERAGLVARERRGRIRWRGLNPVALREAAVWMEGVGLVSPQNYDAFEEFLAAQGLAESPED